MDHGKSDAALLAVMMSDGEGFESVRVSQRCAALIVESVLRGSEQVIVANVAAVKTSGRCAAEAARLLLDEVDAHENLWKPATTLAVARAAERILRGALPQLAFRAIKEQATALRLMGELDRALRESERAEEQAALTAAIEFNVAVARYCRAFVLCEIGRTIEAASLLADARAVFVRYQDHARIETAVSFEATILYREKRYGEAIALYRGSLMCATERGDVARAAMELGNIGHCYTRMNNLREAREYLTAAAGMHGNIGMPIQRAKILRSLARVTIRETGKQSRFDEAAAAFDSLGMIGEWSLTMLALAEEMKTCDSEADVSRICRQVYVRASKAGMVVTAAETLEMLSDARRGRDATPEIIRNVAATIDSAAMESHVFIVN